MTSKEEGRFILNLVLYTRAVRTIACKFQHTIMPDIHTLTDARHTISEVRLPFLS